MARRMSEVCSKSSIQRCQINREEVGRVMRALEKAIENDAHTCDPIMEQLRQCPEAFKVGEILGKAFDSLKYARDEETHRERYLPPSGAVIPPLV